MRTISDPEIQKLADYIQRDLSRDPGRALDLDTPLITSGLLDSLSLISVLAFIEDHYGVVIPDEAATADAMNSVRLILQLRDTYRDAGND